MTHPIITAAREFQADEARREKRGQVLRMPSAESERDLREALMASESATSDENILNPYLRSRRGHLAVDVFGYTDSFDENAATVITDILHAVQAAGYSPQAVLNQAAAYYAEEL